VTLAKPQTDRRYGRAVERICSRNGYVLQIEEKVKADRKCCQQKRKGRKYGREKGKDKL
jgi:hypothetical protein